MNSTSNTIVKLCVVEPGVVQIRMEDRVNKNTFTQAMCVQLAEAFETVASNDTYKVVILTGYDNYFASGGTREALLAMNAGEVKFTDVNIYSLSLDCRIPVISAMQGHGIGGGFVLGLFGDFVILSRESVYTANFMKYGFTPGMGATLMVPRKMGIALGQEMLLLARNYRGEELQQRGAPFPVVPRSEVLTQAVQMARELAEKPRKSLILLKDHLVRQLRAELPDFIEREVAMHAETLHQPEVRDRIDSLFGK